MKQAVFFSLPEQAWRNIWLAGQCLLEIGLKRVERQSLDPELVQRVQHRLTHLITHGLLMSRDQAEAEWEKAARGEDGRIYGEIRSILNFAM